MGGHNPALAVNQGDFRAFDLTRTALAAQLVHRLGDREQRAWMPGVAMGHEAAVGVDRQLPTEFDATAFHKPASLALGTEAQVLQLDDHHRSETVVQLGHVDVPGAEAGHRIGSFPGFPRGRGGQTPRLADVLVRVPFAHAQDVHRPVLKVFRPLG